MAMKTCGQCADGWVCEIHPDEPLTHHVNLAEACGLAMPCTNPTCPLSWVNEVHPDTGLIRVSATDDALAGPWQLPTPVVRPSLRRRRRRT
jgi:hypothetical protein